MSEPTTTSSFAEELKAKHAAEHAHQPTVEEVPDEDIIAHKPAAEAASSEEKPGWVEPPSVKSVGKQKETEAPKAKVLDTQSHELFPSLGGPKPASAGGAAPIWGAKNNNVNGKANGGSTNGTPRASAPGSGAATPTGVPSLSIPGRNVETMYLSSEDVLPRHQLKKPVPDVMKDINRRSKARLSMASQANGRLRFEATGPREIAREALKDLLLQIGAKRNVKLTIPASARAHVIGKGGSTIKSIQERSGARVQLPRVEEGQPPIDDSDDDATIDITLEGNSHSCALAKDEIEKIVGERSNNVNSKVKGVPAEFYPFLAGPNNNFIQNLEENRGVQVRIPPHQPFVSQIPQVQPGSKRPVFSPSENDNHIQLAGERAAVQAVRAEIQRRVEELQQQLELEQLAIQRGRHQFIIGDRGVPTSQFFEDTGCTILLPTDEDDDTITVIGPPENLQKGLERAMDLATTMQCSNVDIARFHRQAPGGAAAHARNVTRYLRQRKEIERLEQQYNVHFNTPFTSEGAQPWELYSRDGKNAIRAQSEIKSIVDSHPPARMSNVPVDPFFHQYLRTTVNPRVHDQYGVHMVIPDTNDPDASVLLVYEGPNADTNAPYQVPRQQPSQADVRNFEQGLREARQHILDLINQQEAISAVSIDVPTKYHTKLQRFIKNEQQNRSGDQIPVRVSSLGTTVNFRGPASQVESMAEKCRAFVEQEKEDEKERGFTMDFEFPQKFANHLIGKGGSNIRELREKFDVEIQVQDGKVELKGPKAKAEAAKAHILSVGRQLADEVTHHLKIDPKFHRELIGAQGAQINRLQTRYKVLIFFPRSGKSSKDDESVADASEGGKPKRQQAPDEVLVRGPKKGADEAREEILSLLQYLKDNSFTATVSVQQKQLPSLIGQGGSGMDQLRQATGARIDIPNGRDIPEGGMVDITVKGTQQQVADAKKILEEKRAVFDNTVQKTLEVDKKYHKALIGAGGSNLRDIVVNAGGSDDRRELARTIQFPKQDADGNTIKVEGRSDIVDKIIAHIQEFVSQRENQVTEVVEVPTEKHRTLIGRGGDIKRGLESQFKVSIDVPRQGSGQTGVKIVGQAPDVEKAKEHILSLIKEQQGETVQVPRKLHHSISNNGQFFRKLRGDHKVTVDHAGQPIPEKVTVSHTVRATEGALPLITDEDDSSADVHSWKVVELSSTEEGDIPWVLRGSPENIEKAKKLIEAALASAAKQDATGYLVLPDPRTYRHVIGQGGSKVNAIRKQSGCKITVPRNQAEDEAIEIVGTKEGVEKAKDLILAAVKEGVEGSSQQRPRD